MQVLLRTRKAGSEPFNKTVHRESWGIVWWPGYFDYSTNVNTNQINESINKYTLYGRR